jgi:hypothetical protein
MRYTRRAIAIATSLWLVGAGVAAAQYTGSDKPAPGADRQAPAADKRMPDRSMDTPTGIDRKSPRTSMAPGETIGRHSAHGEITSLDGKKGWVNLKTSEGTMIVQVPPASLQGLKKGDRITVDLAMKSTGQQSR